MTDFASAALVRVLGKGMQLFSLDTPGSASVSARFRQAPSPRRAATLQHRVKRQIPCLITLP